MVNHYVIFYLFFYSLGRDGDPSHVTSVGEVVIARAHVTVTPSLNDAETRWITGSWRVVKLCL